jgi:effector-binding domain-containing protein
MLAQLRTIHRIVALKDLGLSLEQVARVLEHDLSSAELRGMLRLAKIELEGRIHELQARVGRVEHRLKHLEKEDTMQQDVVVKSVEPLRILSARETSSAFWKDIFWRLHTEVRQQADRAQVKVSGPLMAVYHEDPEDPNVDCDFEVALPIEGTTPDTEGIQIRTLPAVAMMATTLHYGSFDQIYPVYDVIIEWIYANGYTIDGPYRTIHHAWAPDADPATYITEIQFPIKPAKTD